MKSSYDYLILIDTNLIFINFNLKTLIYNNCMDNKLKNENLDRNVENYKINDESNASTISRKDKFNFLNDVFESDDQTDVFLG